MYFPRERKSAMKYENKILKLFKDGYLKTKDVVDAGIPKVYLTKLVNNGTLKRVSRGLYTKPNDIVDEFVIIQNKSKNAIFSNLTSLYLLGLSNRVPIKYDVTVPNNYNGSLSYEININLYYSNKDNLDLGLTSYELPTGSNIHIYDKERSICDIIKNKSKLDSELVNKAIRDYYYSKNKDTLKLYDYARKLKVYNKVRKTFEVLS